MNRPTTPSARVDLRGFAYALTPFVRQQEWQMESLQTQLVQAQRAVAEANAKLESLKALLHAQAAHVEQGLLKRPDPLAHRRGLQFLAQTQQHIVAQKGSVAALVKEHKRLQAESIDQQRKLDGLAEHRAQAEQEYAEEATRREAAEADREWIGRMRYRANATKPMQEPSP